MEQCTVFCNDDGNGDDDDDNDDDIDNNFIIETSRVFVH